MLSYLPLIATEDAYRVSGRSVMGTACWFQSHNATQEPKT